jgi:hypothetical protein
MKIILRSFAILAFLCFFSPGNGQTEKFKFGKVPESDLLMNSYEADPQAEAVILADVGNLHVSSNNFGLYYTFSRKTRIKVLKESGKSHANVSVFLYKGEKPDRINKIKGVVIDQEGNEYDLNKKDIFEEDINEYWRKVSFSLPNVQVGSVLDFTYEIISNRIVTLREWYFQHSIPVRYSEIQLRIPTFLEYVYLFEGEEKIQDESNTEQGAGLGSETSENRSKYFIKDLPAIKEEAYITNLNDYRTSIRFQLSHIQRDNGVLEPFLHSWEKVAEELYQDRYLGGQITQMASFKKLYGACQPFLEKCETSPEKVAAIYDFLAKEMRWSGFYSIYSDEDLDDAFEKREALSGELNLMLIALLRQEGIEAYPFLISTREHGKMLPLYPIMDQFNHLLAYVQLDSEAFFLDLGNRYRPPGLPAIKSLNGAGWLLREKDPVWLALPAPTDKEIVLADFFIDPESGSLNGKFSCRFDQYSAVYMRSLWNEHKGNEKKAAKEWLSATFPGIRIDSVSHESLNDYSADFKVYISCSLSDAMQQNGAFIYMKPVLMSSFSENPFKSEERYYPIDIPYGIQEQFIFNLHLPDDYEVVELPESMSLSLPGEATSFKFIAQESREKVSLISKLAVNRIFYAATEYPHLRQFFNMVMEKLGERIVLQKKE